MNTIHRERIEKAHIIPNAKTEKPEVLNEKIENLIKNMD